MTLSSLLNCFLLAECRYYWSPFFIVFFILFFILFLFVILIVESCSCFLLLFFRATHSLMMSYLSKAALVFCSCFFSGYSLMMSYLSKAVPVFCSCFFGLLIDDVLWWLQVVTDVYFLCLFVFRVFSRLLVSAFLQILLLGDEAHIKLRLSEPLLELEVY